MQITYMYYKNSLPWSWHLGCLYLATAATWTHGMLMCAHGADCTQLLGGPDKTISCYVAKLADLKSILREKLVCMIQLIFALLVLACLLAVYRENDQQGTGIATP